MKLTDTPPPPRRGFLAGLRSSFFTGLIVIAPIGITIWLIWTLTGWIDSWVLPLIPTAYNPALLIREYTGLEIDIRGIGVVTFLLFTVLVGWIAKGIIGRIPRPVDPGDPLALFRAETDRRDDPSAGPDQFRQGLPDRIPAQGHLGHRLHLDQGQGRGAGPDRG
jgi:hypothetical protein